MPDCAEPAGRSHLKEERQGGRGGGVRILVCTLLLLVRISTPVHQLVYGVSTPRDPAWVSSRLLL